MGDLDRRKHDVDIIERVLGGIRDSGQSDSRTRVVDVDFSRVSDDRSPTTLELTIGLDDSESNRRRRSR
jgi:hypothetical protein